MNNPHKGFVAPLLLALIALLFIGGGVYVYTQQKQANPPASGNVALPQATSTAPTKNQTAPVAQTTNSQTAGWKTYTNTKYGFELKIPQSYKAIPLGAGEGSRAEVGIIFLSESDNGYTPHASIALPITEDSSYNPKAKNLADYAHTYTGNFLIDYGKSLTVVIENNRELEINGAQALEQVFSQTPGDFPGAFVDHDHRFIFYKDGEFIILHEGDAHKKGDAIELLEQIASTFKFTTQTAPTATANWKTKDNLAYSFKYPQDLTFRTFQTNFVDLTAGSEASVPASYNLSNSFQRSQIIYIGLNGAKNKEACMSTHATSPQYSAFIAHMLVAGVLFNKYQTKGDCAMDGCSIGNTYTTWSVDTCYEISWFAIQSNPSKLYDGPTDSRTVAAEVAAETTTQKITLLTEQILSTFKFITPTQEVSVPGMSKYTNTDFGFSFWYPSGSEVKQAFFPTSDFSNGTVVKQLSVYNGPHNGAITVFEVTSPTRTIAFKFDSPASEYSSERKYWFDIDTHTWMKTDVTYSQPPMYATSTADVSRNTMGGLHILDAYERQTHYGVIPLSAKNFIIVYDGLLGDPYIFANTIVASDPKVATPVSAAEQIKTIQAEAKAYRIQVLQQTQSVTETENQVTSPITTSITGPKSLSTGQEGSWNMKAPDATRFSVIWADGTPVNVGEGSGIPYDNEFTANSTSSHVFTKPGTYFIQFFAKNSVGVISSQGFTINVK